MATIDQSTRRGRLITVFIGGLIIFGCVTLAGLYLSNQRQRLLEASQNGESSQVTNLDDSNEEVTDERNGSTGDDEGESGVANDEEALGSEAEESVDSVASTGPSSYDGEASEEEESVGATLPNTGPSDAQGEEVPAEIPATGPELWIIAIVGGLIALYLTFEYRRSRLAFQRAALRRE